MPYSPAEIRSLRIDGLLPTMDPVYLFNCFYDNAEVLATTVLRNWQTGNQEDYGFVEFASESVAKFVLNSYGGEPMPNYNNNNRYRLNWDYDGFGTRWRWDPAFKCCSFFGCDKWGKEFDAYAVIQRYKDSIPVEPFPAAGQNAAYQNAFPNNIENQLHHTQRHGPKRLKLLSPYPNMYEGGVAANQIYQHPGPILTIQQQNQLVQTQWNGGCGAAGFSPNMIHLHHINMSHGGLAGYVNYQQHDLYPQAGYVNYQQHDLYPQAGFANYQQHDLYPQAGYVNFQQHDHYRQTCAYQPPYQQLQTRCTVGSDTLTHELVTQVTKRDLKRKCSIKEKEKEKEKELYLCFRELNWVRKTCYVFRTIKLSELFACSCKLPDESDPEKCKYCAKTNKPKSQLRQRAWLYAGEKVPASCGGEKARIPVRMGCCVSGSQFFFAGGENRTRGKYVPSGDVYSFVPESTSWQKHDWSFQKGKPDPMLLEVNGNFYCLAGKTIACALEKPTFEVYNSSTRDCEPLPDPPFHLLELESGHSQHCWCSKNLAYAVVGTKILVSSTAVHEPFTNLPISCFDVKDEEKKWRDMPTLFDGKPFPFDGRALVLDLNGATSDKVMFSFREKCFIYVSQLVENGDGDISISHDDCLEYFPEDILMPDLDAILSHDFVDLGNQKVGFVVCGTIYDWEEEDIDPHRKVRVVVVVIHYGADPEVPGLLSNEIQSARCFEYKCHSPAIISSDLVGSFVV